jgi:uncharacterized protein involved in exopolysaccharide biosynthesis
MTEHHRAEYVQYVGEGRISVSEYAEILRPHLLKVMGISLVVGVATLLYLFTKPNMYRSSATITPVVEEKQNPALGAIASFGIAVGGPTKLEDLEALFKSNDLTVRVFQNHNLWPVLLQHRFDSQTGKMKTGWRARLFGKVEPKAPSDWDAIRSAEANFVASANKKTGNMVVTFETRSPVESARIVGYYLEEAKDRLQEEALERASKNKKFIQEQIGKTVDALTRDRLYALYGQEVEKEMMARNREQFGFRVIDSPRVPDTKSRPSRLRISLLAFAITWFIASFFYVLKAKNRKPMP